MFLTTCGVVLVLADNIKVVSPVQEEPSPWRGYWGRTDLLPPDSSWKRWDETLHFSVCVFLQSNGRPRVALQWREASRVRPLDCGRGRLELLCWKEVISILVKWSATVLLTSLAPTPCIHRYTYRSTRGQQHLSLLIPPILANEELLLPLFEKKKEAAYIFIRRGARDYKGTWRQERRSMKS